MFYLHSLFQSSQSEASIIPIRFYRFGKVGSGRSNLFSCTSSERGVEAELSGPFLLRNPAAEGAGYCCSRGENLPMWFLLYICKTSQKTPERARRGAWCWTTPTAGCLRQPSRASTGVGGSWPLLQPRIALPVSDVWMLVLWVRGGKDCGQAGWEDCSEDNCLQEKKKIVELRAAKEIKRWEVRASRDKCLQREGRSSWGGEMG